MKNYDHLDDALLKAYKQLVNGSLTRCQLGNLVYLLGLNPDTNADYRRCVLNMFARRRRLNKRVESILCMPFSYFCTFTLDDKHLHLSMRYLLDNLKRLLNIYSSNWVANSDFGDEANRLHFHALFGSNCECDCTINWTFGYSKILPVHSVKDADKLSRYMYKLSNHACKSTAQVILYSRSKRS